MSRDRVPWEEGPAAGVRVVCRRPVMDDKDEKDEKDEHDDDETRRGILRRSSLRLSAEDDRSLESPLFALAVVTIIDFDRSWLGLFRRAKKRRGDQVQVDDAAGERGRADRCRGSR